MRKSRIYIATALAAVMALSSFGFDAAQAAGRQQTSKPVASTDNSTTIDMSARKRYRRNNNAAAAAAAIGIIGVIGALAAQNRYRNDYYGRGYYGRGYYGGGYYGGRTYNHAPRYRGQNYEYRGQMYGSGRNPGYHNDFSGNIPADGR